MSENLLSSNCQTLLLNLITLKLCAIIYLLIESKTQVVIQCLNTLPTRLKLMLMRTKLQNQYHNNSETCVIITLACMSF